MGEARIVEQAIPERCLPKVLNRRDRNRSDRFLGEFPLRRRSLRDRRPQGAEIDDGEEQARYAAGRSEGGRRQSQAQTRGRHGDFTNS